MNFTIMKVDKLDRVTEFDQTLTKPQWVSAVTQYKEVALRVKLGIGKYVIIPSTSQAGMTGKFALSIYSNCSELMFDMYHMKGAKKADWVQNVNQYQVIAEEDED
jgi:hypothetical protein